MSFDILGFLNISYNNYISFCEKEGLVPSLNKKDYRLKEEAELYKKLQVSNLLKNKNKYKKLSFEEQFHLYLKENNYYPKITEIENFNYYLKFFNKFSPKDVFPITDFLYNISFSFIEPFKKLENYKPKSKNPQKVAMDILNNYIFKYPVIDSLSSCFFDKSKQYHYSLDKHLNSDLKFAVYQLSQGIKFKDINFFNNINLTRKQIHFALNFNSKYNGLAHLRFAQIKDYQQKIINAVMNNTNKTENFSQNESIFQDFLIYLNNQSLDMFETDQIMPLFDYVCFKKRQAVLDNVTFNIKHHSLINLYHGMIEWHRSLNSKNGTLEWEPSPLFKPLEIIKEKKINNFTETAVYKIIELTNEKSLIEEGKKLHHCVASYAKKCHNGLCRIFSLRYGLVDEKLKPLATIEVVNNKPVQIRGRFNQEIIGEEYNIIKDYFKTI